MSWLIWIGYSSNLMPVRMLADVVGFRRSPVVQGMMQVFLRGWPTYPLR